MLSGSERVPEAARLEEYRAMAEQCSDFREGMRPLYQAVEIAADLITQAILDDNAPCAVDVIP
jgi:hypothetical protein